MFYIDYPYIGDVSKQISILFEERNLPETPPAGRLHQVWFDADDGRRLLAELNLRCEAGWRYSAADQEERSGGRVSDSTCERSLEC